MEDTEGGYEPASIVRSCDVPRFDGFAGVATIEKKMSVEDGDIAGVAEQAGEITHSQSEDHLAGDAGKAESNQQDTTAVISSIPIKQPLGPGPFSLDDFDLGATLGTGSFGRVRIAIHNTTQTPWAIKILKKAEIMRMQQVL